MLKVVGRGGVVATVSAIGIEEEDEPWVVGAASVTSMNDTMLEESVRRIRST